MSSSQKAGGPEQRLPSLPGPNRAGIRPLDSHTWEDAVMLTPIITGYGGGGVAVRSDTLQLIGTGFGRVSSVALVDTMGNQFECEFQVDSGQSIHLTVPRLLPDGTYVPRIGTLDNIASQNMAGILVVPALVVDPPSPPPAPEPVPDPASPAMLVIRQRLRQEIGDYEESFQASVQGDGFARRFDLPEEVINTTGLSVVLALENPAGGYDVPTVQATPADYQLEAREGIITMTTAPPDDAILTVTGRHNQFFTDDELDLFIRSAALKHTHSAESLQVYRDVNGFKHFLYTNQTVDGIAPVEYHAVALLAAVEALEVIRSDSAFDIDVTTSDGTSLPREERFRNLGELIATKQTRYDDMCAKLGVGMGRIEVFTFRRVSRTTGKLVPVYVNREYDDVRTPPLRLFAPRNLGITGSGFVQPDPHAYYGSGGP